MGRPVPFFDAKLIDAEGRGIGEDKLGELIIRGGENVYCVEIENCLAAFKVPEFVEFTNSEFPRNPAGEILKEQLRGRRAEPSTEIFWPERQAGPLPLGRHGLLWLLCGRSLL